MRQGDWPSEPPELAAILEGVVRGERRSVARCLRWIDEIPQLGLSIASALHEHLKGAQVIGVTGNPGAGKSTVVSGLLHHLRAAGRRVAVLAVDPSSPFTGGAILGDRIRMSQHATDEGVFIRSLATRGALGGLSESAFDSVRVLDAAGYDVVVIETVGVGQDEVDVARLAETTVLVMVPGLGDDVQAIKAGLLEVADIFLINKADRDGVEAVEHSLNMLLALDGPSNPWQRPILRAVASRREGLEALLAAIDEHREFVFSASGHPRVSARAIEIFDRLVDAALVGQGRSRLADRLEEARERVGQGSDPYVEAVGLVDPVAHKPGE